MLSLSSEERHLTLPLQYALELLPFKAAGFQTAAGVSPDVLLTEKIVIVTARTPGVGTRSFAPPEYTQEQCGNYDNALGYLENGNQRFYHHQGGGGVGGLG